MKTLLLAGFSAALLTLAACGDDPVENPDNNPPATRDAPSIPESPRPESQTERQTREAGDAIQDAARATGDAAGAAFDDLRNAAGPAMDRAREEGGRALDSAREGLNDLTRGAACQTARGANDVEGIAANC